MLEQIQKKIFFLSYEFVILFNVPLLMRVQYALPVDTGRRKHSIQPHTHTHTQAQAHTHTHPHIHTPPHIKKLTQTHTPTHTHTHYKT